MRLSHILSLFGLAVASSASSSGRGGGGGGGGSSGRNYQQYDYYVLQLTADTTPGRVAQTLGLTHQGPFGALADHHVYVGPKGEDDVVDAALRRRRRRRRKREIDVDDDEDAAGGSERGDGGVLDSIRFAQKQLLRKPWQKREAVIGPQPQPQPRPRLWQATPRNAAAVALQDAVMKELQIADPIFRQQWHLINTVQVGHDVNIAGVWRQGVTGKNVTVAVVDDGLDMDSDDLGPNYYAAGSYDFNDHVAEPRPTLPEDRHGTRCAGEVAAARNDACGVGVAYEGKVAGLRILSKLITDSDEALAMMYDMAHNWIYSCSWGPPDDGLSMDAPGVLIRRAMLTAIQQGRGDLGSIYVFASGNGAGHDDNCNFDGYTNSIYSITVGAVDRMGQSPYYSEKCSALLVVTYSSGSGDAIHTTDVGKSNCYDGHGGTSAAAPLAAGLFALVLEVRPELSWRDMQYLVVDSAVPLNEDEKSYQVTGRGRKFSHTYGYGKIDSLAMVELAKTFKPTKPQAWFVGPWVHVNHAVPQGRDGLLVAFEVTAQMLQEANVETVEHVTVTMNVNHTRRGDLSVDLISPVQVISHLATARKHDAAVAGYVDWTFMSVAHWGESGIGTWQLIVRDTVVNEHEGLFVDFRLKLWGESIDPSKTFRLPMPNEDDDADHEVTTTAAVATATTMPVAGPTATGTVSFSDHPYRPTKIQPNPETTGSAAMASQTPLPAPQDEAEEGAVDESHWLSWLPTFGVSTKAQLWIYGAAVLIAVFCAGLAVYLWRARWRRRAAMGSSRDAYEFELLRGQRGEKGRRRQRGGELYDAFAGGSDDDDDVEAELLSDDDDDHGADDDGNGNGYDEEGRLRAAAHYRDHGVAAQGRAALSDTPPTD